MRDSKVLSIIKYIEKILNQKISKNIKEQFKILDGKHFT